MTDDTRPALDVQHPEGGNGFPCQVCDGIGYVRNCGVAICDECAKGIPEDQKEDAAAVRLWVAARAIFH